VVIEASMKPVIGETFEDETMDLDGRRFEDCQFLRCELRFGGTAPVALVRCNFIDCTWFFIGAAASTINFLSALRRDGSGWIVDSVVASAPLDPGQSAKETARSPIAARS